MTIDGQDMVDRLRMLDVSRKAVLLLLRESIGGPVARDVEG
ncbi:hypothetical protein [Cupriavidus pauculus]|nr:hypothetical protein [Cupriavidus pauculus]